MPGRSILKATLPVFVLLAALFSLSTGYLHAGVVCIEGGPVVGFPFPFFIQCYGPLILGGGQAIDPPQFLLGGLVFDLGFWYIVSMVFWMLGLRVFARFRGETAGSRT